MKISYSKSSLHIVILTSLLISLIGGLVLVTPAQAATFVVTKTADTADGTCDADCSLREAIIAANAAAGNDTITVPAGTYTLTIAGTGEDATATGDLDITSNITINGAGAGSTIIQAGTIGYPGVANGIDRVFHVTGAFTVNISGVTVRNGSVAGATDGGGLYNDGGTLTITNSTFSGNSTSGGNGGGLFNFFGSTTMNNSTFSSNSASDPSFGGGGNGGGLFNTGNLTVTNSTFSGNSASDPSFGGGGIYSDFGTVTISNSTFSSNTTAGSGGGLLNTFDSSSTITNSTFSGNGASASNGGGSRQGGGTVTLKNTIVANSTAGGNCAGTLTDGGNNLDSANTCGFTTNAKINTNPNLGDLTGSPQYFPLNSGSAAIDAGSNTVCAAAPVNNTSQNGVTRPMPIGGTCDIGSYEYRETTPPTVVFGAGSVPSADGAILAGGPSSLLVQFSENMMSDGNEHAANSGWNYLLLRPGLNGVFDTTVTSPGICDSDHVIGSDDEQIEISSITYNAATFTATLNIGLSNAPLANGQYRLYLCGLASIWDLSTNPLNGGANSAINFSVVPAPAAAAAVPDTGFAPDRVTVLAAQPAEKTYAGLSDLWLEIPKLGVQMPIVGVPQTGSEWDVSWLGTNAGWLQGSAFPTWEGNSVLTGHVWNADNTVGPFRYINTLWWGDKVIVHAWGAQYVYEVRAVTQVSPGNVNAMMKHEELPWVTLVTCRGYDQTTGDYKYRVLVRAVLVEVK
ncbi:MAG: sortase [Chloroflexi bacterium]|nr:sortase [Chloroflexota bacterium]